MNERVIILQTGGKRIPVLVFPDDEQFRLTLGAIHEDPGQVRGKLEEWLNEWIRRELAIAQEKS